MVPKLDQRRRNASKLRIPPRRSVTINSGNKPVAGPFMRQKEGQEFRQITVESRKVVPIHLPASLTKLCRSSCEHTQALSRLPTKMGGLIDTSARLAGGQAPPLTLLS